MRGRNNNAYNMMGEFAFQTQFFNNDAAIRERIKDVPKPILNDRTLRLLPSSLVQFEDNQRKYH